MNLRLAESLQVFKSGVKQLPSAAASRPAVLRLGVDVAPDFLAFHGPYWFVAAGLDR